MSIQTLRILALGFIVDIILLDQLSKWALTELVLRPETGGEPVGLLDWIVNAPERVGFASIPVMPSFNLTMVWNEGVSFGMMNGFGIWPLVVISLIVCAFFLRWLLKSSTGVEAFGLAMVIGGALGNVIDRLRFGAVADFFDVYVGSYHWPAFNIADAAITIGVAMMLVYGLFLNRNDKGDMESHEN